MKGKTTAFCFIGMPGSGKTTAMSQMEKVSGSGLRVSTGDIVRDMAAEHHGTTVEELTGEQIGEFSTHKRENDSPLYVAKEVEDILEDNPWWPKGLLLIEGVRDSEAMRYYESFIDNFVIVFIHAPFETRLERLSDRGREEDEEEYTADDLMHREQRELDWGMDELPNYSDYVVMNTGNIKDLRFEVSRVFEDEFDTIVPTEPC